MSLKKYVPLFLLASNLSLAAVPIDGWYSEVFGGYSYIPNNVNTTLNGLNWTDPHYISGYHGGGRFGYKDAPMRYEAEVAYISGDVNRFKVDDIYQTGITGQTSSTNAMVNVYYDFPEVIKTIEPFAGVGIGYAYVNAHFYGSGPSTTTEFRGANSAFAYQGTLGLAYNFANNYSLDVAYRYFATDNISELGKMFQAHLASAGVTYRFDGDLYK